MFSAKRRLKMTHFTMTNQLFKLLAILW